MNRKTEKVLGIIFAFLINLGVYIAIIWMLILISDRLEGDNPNLILSVLNGMLAYSIFLKIKPFRVQKLIEKYADELLEE